MSDKISIFVDTIFGNERYMLLVRGLIFVLITTFLASVIGIILGIILAVFKFSNDFLEETKFKNLKKFNPFFLFSNLYINIIRGTPVIVQLMILHNFIMVGVLKNTPTIIVSSIGLGLNSAAYIAEIIRSGIKSLDKGQMEAARALGMPYLLSMTKIILPQAFKNMIPTFVNEFISLLKETSVVTYIGGRDLIKAAQDITYLTLRGIEPWLAVALIYLILTSIFTFIMNLVERKIGKSD